MIDPERMRVNDHAIRRWRERSGSKQTDDTIRTKLRNMVREGNEHTMRERWRIYSLLDYPMGDCHYMVHGGWVVVVRDNRIATVYPFVRRVWEPKA
jgi:hypothetical protein